MFRPPRLFSVTVTVSSGLHEHCKDREGKLLAGVRFCDVELSSLLIRSSDQRATEDKHHAYEIRPRCCSVMM